jgi:clan AA aspartic protease (TIGR02281 family)
MICRRCHSENPDDAPFCSKCGSYLTRKPVRARRQLPWYAFLAGALVLISAGFFLSRAVFRSPGARSIRNVPTRAGNPAPLPAAAPEPTEAAASTTGTIIVVSPYGRETSRWPAAVIDGQWVALPAWALLGGGKLTLDSGGAGTIPIEWGVWTDMNPIVLCRLDRQAQGKSPRVAAWRPDIRLQWRSLGQDGSSYDIGGISPASDGAYLSFPLPDEARNAGVFLQDNAVVGWTFGPGDERGYLWSGAVSLDRAPRTRLSEISETILSGSREARFAGALDLGDSAPPALRLKALGDGFGSAPAFEAEDVPASLRPEAIIGRMHAAASELIREGAAPDAARILDDELLAEAGSAVLVEDAVRAQAAMRGFESGLLELERLEKKASVTRDLDPAELNGFKAQLYKQWLREIIGAHGSGGRDVFEKAELAFPDDPEIHLMGVEIAVLEKNWPRAAELLRMRQYPDAFSARASMLGTIIQQGQSDAGTAVLKFDPGTEHIHVEAVVNGKLSQKFIIDTGAEMSSIPSSAVEALGIRIDDDTKVIVVQGIAGRGLTHEVTLDSIDLAGLRVDNVQAIIADMPGYEDTGIIGQNVLNKFHVDIDYQKGILKIRKR